MPNDITVELALGADLTADPGTWSWTDITQYVRYPTSTQAIAIRVGRNDESGEAQPSTCRLTLDNTSGRFTPRLPSGAYYPNIRLNVPLRVTLDPGSGSVERFLGYVDEWPLRWHESGNEKRVEITASGVLRRLAQGRALRSALYRAVLADPPTEYWPMEDGPDSAELLSAVGGASLVVSGIFGTEAGPGGSADLIKTQEGTNISGVVRPIGGTEWTLEIVAKIPNLTVLETPAPVYILDWYCPGTARYFTLVADDVTGNFLVNWVIGTTGFSITLSAGVHAFDGVWRHLRVDQAQVGGNVEIYLYVDGVLSGSGTFAGTIGAPTSVAIYNFEDVDPAARPSVGHLRVWATPLATLDLTAAMMGWPGEEAAQRIARVCSEENIAVSISASSSEPMGPQPLDTLLAVLRDCEATDGGILYDSGGGVAYVSRADRENQSVALSLNYASGHLRHPLEANDDDQALRNDITASKPGGSSARYIDETGPLGTAAVGVYADTATVNVELDSALHQHAGWRVALGTVDDLRYPGINISLTAKPSLTTSWLAFTLGERVTVASPPAELPPGSLDLQVVGYEETLTPHWWGVAMNTVPNRPWNVIELDGSANTSRLDTAGSKLNGAHNSSTTSLSVETTSGELWTTSSGDRPFDIEVGGEQMTVTNVTGASSPQTFTVTRSVNGVTKLHADDAAVALWRPSVLAL